MARFSLANLCQRLILPKSSYIDTALSWFAMSTISGGVLKMMDRIGPRKVLRLLSEYTAQYGEQYAPFKKLWAVAAEHTTFTQKYGEPDDIAPRLETEVRDWKDAFKQWKDTPEITKIGDWAKGNIDGLGNWGPKDAEIPSLVAVGANRAMVAQLPLYEGVLTEVNRPTTPDASFFFGVSMESMQIWKTGRDNQLVIGLPQLSTNENFEAPLNTNRHFILDVNFGELERMDTEQFNGNLRAGLWDLLKGGKGKPKFVLHEIDPVALAKWEGERAQQRIATLEAPFKELTGGKLLGAVLDPDRPFVEISEHLKTADPLGFEHPSLDKKYPILTYAAKIDAEEKRTGETSAVITGWGTIGGVNVAIASMDFNFIKGTLSPVEGEKIKRLIEFAGKNKLPLVIMTASGGARMQQSAESLMQLAKISSMIKKYKEEGGYYVSVLMDPTTGGVSASFAFQSDYVMAEKGARIAFAGEDLVRYAMGFDKTYQFPPGFQRAERLQKFGYVNEIFARRELREKLAEYLNDAVKKGKIKKTNNWRQVRYVSTPQVPGSLRDIQSLSSGLSPYEQLNLARHPGRPNFRKYLELWEEQGAQFEEMFPPVHPDDQKEPVSMEIKMARWVDSQAIIGGTLTLPNGQKFMLIGTYKGPKGTWGPGPYAYRRSREMMGYAKQHDLPIVTLVDLPGASSMPQSEDDGISKELAINQEYMSTLTVPVLSIITGEGGSGGAIAIGMGNRVLMMENAFYSVISPEFAAQILYAQRLKELKLPKDKEDKLINSVLPELTASLKISSVDLFNYGLVDGIIKEPPGGAQVDPQQAASNLLQAISDTLPIFKGMSAQDIRDSRLTRYSNMGSTAVSSWEDLKTETKYFLDHLALTKDEENEVSLWMEENREQLRHSLSLRFNLRQILANGKMQQNIYIDFKRNSDRFIVTRTIDNNGKPSETQSHAIYLKDGAFDHAMNAPGGIDLNASNGMQWKVSKDGRGVEMNIDPAMIERIRREGIDSLSPVIFRIIPVRSFWSLVGLQPPVPAERLVGA